MRNFEIDADILDSRDIDERIEELKELVESVEADEEELNELEALESFRDRVSNSEWRYGLTMIRDTYFQEYAKVIARDIGAVSGDEQWPMNCIDWEAAARELQYDYSAEELNGVRYWYYN